jgi:hypothetical protein
LGHPWDSLGQLGIENGGLRMEVLKTQPFAVHLSPFPAIDRPKAIWDLGFRIQNPKPKTKNQNLAAYSLS